MSSPWSSSWTASSTSPPSSTATPPATSPASYIPTPQPESLESLDRFHPFPRLPRELRFRIWEAISFLPRLVDVRTRCLGRINGSVASEDLTGWRCTQPVPAVLHVSQESRIEALQYYKLDFGSRLLSTWLALLVFAKIYINFDADVVFVDGLLDERLAAASEVELCQKPIRKLAFPVNTSHYSTTLGRVLFRMCGFRYLRLQEIILVPVQETGTVAMPLRLESYIEPSTSDADDSDDSDDSVHRHLHAAAVVTRGEIEHRLRARENLLGNFRKYFRGQVDMKTIMDGYVVEGHNDLSVANQQFVHGEKTRRFTKEMKDFKNMMKEDKTYGRWVRPKVKIMQLAMLE